MLDSFPRFNASPANWKGSDLAKTPDRWMHDLSAAELGDLEAVIAAAGSRTDDLTNVTASDLPLPHLAPKLREIKANVLDGVGLSLIRGLPIDRYNLRQAATAFWAVGLHLGDAVSQNAAGHALGHVRDLGFDYSQPSSRGYRQRNACPITAMQAMLSGCYPSKHRRPAGFPAPYPQPRSTTP